MLFEKYRSALICNELACGQRERLPIRETLAHAVL